MPTETKKQNLALKFATAKAGIVREESGRPIRTIVEWGHRKPVGKFVSLKCGMAMPWESFHDLHLMWLSEADFCVEQYLAQPFRMWFRMKSGNTLTYVPDLERRLTGNRWEVIEVKRTKDEASREPFYAEKLARACQVGQALGFHFRVMTAEKHIRGIALRNAEAIVRDRFTQVVTADMETVYSAADRSGALPYGRAIEVLSPRKDRWDPTGRAKLHALVVRRIASVDIFRTVKNDTPVRLFTSISRAAA